MLDLHYKLAVLQLCDTCWLTLLNMAVKDDRMGANAQFDFFVGEGHSVINATNVVRNRQSCTEPQTAARLIERTTRSARFLGPGNSSKQVYGVADLTWRGQLYPDTLHLQNYSTEFPKHYNGGYAVVLRNTWRLCHSYVDPSCLLERDSDICVAQHLEQLLKGQQQGAGPGQLSPGATAAAVLGAVLVAAAVATLLGCRRRWWRQQGPQGSPKAVDPEAGLATSAQSSDLAALRDSKRSHPGSAWHNSPKFPAGGGGSSSGGGSGVSGGGGSSGCSALLFSRDGRDSPRNIAQCSASRRPSQQPLPGSTASLNTSILCNIMTDLQFGPLLGTGSYGRVYKARLGDCDVAVKVIEHDSRMAAAVQNEVALMLSCKHPNVVAAYHYVTHNHGREAGDAAAAAAAAPGAASDGRGVRDTGGSSSRRDSGQAPGVGGSSAGGTPHPSTPAAPCSLGSMSAASYNSQHSMDKPIPVLPGPKPARKPCPVCDIEVWPTSASKGAQPSGSSGSGPASPGGRPAGAQTPKCTCGTRDAAGAQSGLLKHTQHEGGFWPAGPSALMETTEDSFDEDPGSMVTTWLIQEYCDSGTLGKQASSWTYEDDTQMLKRLLLLQDVVKGLSYLHARQVVHGDLNARNVLVTTSPTSPCGLTAKLADFGLSRTIKQHNTHHTTCTVGTMSHQPPELLRHGHMSTAVDIFALAIMMWELYTREIAFRDLHYGQFFETVVLRNQRPPVPPNMPEDYKVLMEHCWAAEPSQRPSTKAILECISLMIADRQHSLGLNERDIGAVDRRFLLRQHSGSGDGPATHAASAVQQQLRGGREQLHQQPAAAPQLQQQQWHQLQRQQEARRQPTPARLPPHQRQQQPARAAGLSPVHAALHQQRQQQAKDVLAQQHYSGPGQSLQSLHSSGHESSGPQLTSSSLGTSGSLSGGPGFRDRFAAVSSSSSPPAPAAAGNSGSSGMLGQQRTWAGVAGATGRAVEPQDPEGFLRDL